MSVQMSKAVTDLLKVGNSVIDAGKQHAPRVTAALDERFVDLPQPRPDFQTLQLGLVALVENAMQELLVFDETHVTEIAVHRALIEEREAAIAELAARIGEVRNVWEGVYGASASSTVCGGVTDLPADPLELHRLGVRVHRNLTDESLALPPPRPGWPAIDRLAIAAAFAASVTRLSDALEAIYRERKVTEGSLFDKTATIEGFEHTVRFAGECLEALYSLAGFEYLATKVRPKRRAAPRPKQTPPGEGETAPTGTTGGPPANDNPSAPPQLLPGSGKVAAS